MIAGCLDRYVSLPACVSPAIAKNPRNVELPAILQLSSNDMFSVMPSSPSKALCCSPSMVATNKPVPPPTLHDSQASALAFS